MKNRTTRGALALTVLMVLLLGACGDPHDEYFGYTTEYGRRHRVCGKQTISKPSQLVKGRVDTSFDGFSNTPGCSSRDDTMPDGWMGAKGELWVDGVRRASADWKYNNEPFRAWIEMSYNPSCSSCQARVYGQHRWHNKDADAYKGASSWSVYLTV